ncbi:hypothetical protein PPTG_00448 [Phytophthora nicotianae INRA-310]|uniref:Uncharacterized protein n=1 Tax=Phytophthora nicotianae (strain INRA-310) TaxID=761204 RepID=W2RHC6_PHYN3|nr:hypothetical protein PPTG_00448 [Phytophthora nicotianae INRA-310]ETN23980.1 hypothetical protein PPTG_00448 [Phytophthora nicotianae INRA-310]
MRKQVSRSGNETANKDIVYVQGINTAKKNDNNVAVASTDTAKDNDTSGRGTDSAQVRPAAEEVVLNRLFNTQALDFVQRRQAVIRFVQDAIAASANKQKLNADNVGTNNTNEFKKDSLVLLAAQALPRHAVLDFGASKLAPCFIGPFMVLERHGNAYTWSLEQKRSSSRSQLRPRHASRFCGGRCESTRQAAVRKAHDKSSKRYSKGSALKGATKVASEAVDASGDSVASKRQSSHRSRSPSMSPDDRPNPRFACRAYSHDSEDEAKARSFHSVLHSLASDLVDHESKTPECSESHADEAKGSPNAGGDEGANLPKNLSLAEGFDRTQAAKATEDKHSRKRMASRSLLREGKETRPYSSIFD